MEKVEHVLRTGWLIKSPPLTPLKSLFNSWTLRFFALVELQLNLDVDGMEFRLVLKYYESQVDFKRANQPLGQINLDDCLRIEPSKKSIGDLQYIINVFCSDRVFHLCASSENQRLKWLRTLRYYRFGNLPESAVSLSGGTRTKKKGKLRRVFSVIRTPKVKHLIQNWPKEEYEWEHRPMSYSARSDEISVSSGSTAGSDTADSTVQSPVTVVPMDRIHRTCAQDISFEAQCSPAKLRKRFSEPCLTSTLNSSVASDECGAESSDDEDYEDMSVLLTKIQHIRPREKSIREIIDEAEFVTDV